MILVVSGDQIRVKSDIWVFFNQKWSRRFAEFLVFSETRKNSRNECFKEMIWIHGFALTWFFIVLWFSKLIWRVYLWIVNLGVLFTYLGFLVGCHAGSRGRQWCFWWVGEIWLVEYVWIYVSATSMLLYWDFGPNQTENGPGWRGSAYHGLYDKSPRAE